MSIVDQGVSARRIRERLAETESPRHRKMLETVAAHLDAESDISLEGLMATLVDEPKYHLWDKGVDNGPKGAAGVRAFYTQLVEDKRGILEFDIDRIVVDDKTVVTEGYIRAIQQGRVSQGRGYEIDDVDGNYLVESRVVIFWPFDEAGKMIGEDGYANFNPKGARKLDDSELPESYRQLFAGV